jgi:Ca-activated chloride channel homolog
MTLDSLARLAFRAALTLSFCCSGARACHAQSGIAATEAIAPEMSSALTVSKRVQEVSLILTVTDHKGHFVRDLTRSDFTIQDNGKAPQQITYFDSQTDLPLRVAVVLDTSESVGYQFRFQQRMAATFLKHVLRHNSDLALIMGFGDEAHVAQGLTGDVRSLSNAIQGLRVGGETALYDAVSAASKELGKINDVQPSRRIVVLITDGQDNHSHIDLGHAAEIAQRNDCFVYVMSTGSSAINGRLEEPDQAMKRLSEATGGSFQRAGNDSQMRDAFATLAAALRSQYSIGYKPANTSPDGSFHQLTVLGPRKLRIFHRQGYFAK